MTRYHLYHSLDRPLALLQCKILSRLPVLLHQALDLIVTTHLPLASLGPIFHLRPALAWCLFILLFADYFYLQARMQASHLYRLTRMDSPALSYPFVSHRYVTQFHRASLPMIFVFRLSLSRC